MRPLKPIEYRQELLLETSEKLFFTSEQPEFIIQRFKSNGNGNGKHPHHSAELASLKNELNCYLLEYLTGYHIPTHFVKKVSDSDMLVKNLKTLPLQVNVYNSAFGEFAKRFGVKEGAVLEFPVVEHYHLHDHTKTWLNEHHVSAFNIATPEEFKQINRIATKANAVLRGLFERRNLELVALQLEFGRDNEQIALSGEFSLNTCRILDTTPNRHRFILNGIPHEQVYAELRDRLLLKT